MAKSFNWYASASYNAPQKDAFHSMTRARLRKLAQALNLAAGTFDIRSNRGGIAVSGEITLHTDSVYVQVSQPFCGPYDSGILVRTCNGRKDYSGGQNHFAPLSKLDDIEALARFIRLVIYRNTYGVPLARLHNRIWYWPSFESARDYVTAHNVGPESRIVSFDLGYAIQLYKSGPYVSANH